MGTGHRPRNYVEYKDYKNSLVILVDSISDVIKKKEIEVSAVITGMAIGFDTALAMYAVYNNIPLFSYIPFVGQEYDWSVDMQLTYQKLIKRAAKIHVSVDHRPTDYKKITAALHKRNSDMLKDTDLCLTFHRPEITTGGTANVIQKARARKIPTIPIWEEYEKKAKEANILIKDLNK